MWMLNTLRLPCLREEEHIREYGSGVITRRSVTACRQSRAEPDTSVFVREIYIRKRKFHSTLLIFPLLPCMLNSLRSPCLTWIIAHSRTPKWSNCRRRSVTACRQSSVVTDVSMFVRQIHIRNCKFYSTLHLLPPLLWMLNSLRSPCLALLCLTWKIAQFKNTKVTKVE